MTRETMWKPFDVEEMIKEMNLLWDSVFFRSGRRIKNKNIHILETKEVRKLWVSKRVEVKEEKFPE